MRMPIVNLIINNLLCKLGCYVVDDMVAKVLKRCQPSHVADMPLVVKHLHV